MRSVLPGRPEPTPQALSTGFWNSINIVVYITGNAIAILDSVSTILQTIYSDDAASFEAVAFDQSSGKIAACCNRLISVYKPATGIGHRELLKWSLQLAFEIPGRDPELPAVLCWGASEELLIGTSLLSLFYIGTDGSCLWKKRLATAARRAVIAADSSHIASVGHVDCLVKVWRRLSYDPQDVTFSLCYLRHQDPVTDIVWHRANQPADKLIYALTSKNAVHIWARTGASSDGRFALVNCIHLPSSSDSIRSSQLPSHYPLAAVLDGCDLAAFIQNTGTNLDHARTFDKISAAAGPNVDMCILFESLSKASAWPLSLSQDSFGASADPVTFSISPLKLPLFASKTRLHSEVRSYFDRRSGLIHLLLHSLDGKIVVYNFKPIDLFGHSIAVKKPISSSSTLSGHSESIIKLVRNFSGHAVVSKTIHGEIAIWQHNPLSIDQPLVRRSIVAKGESIDRICILRHGLFVVFLGEDAISLWDCRVDPARAISRQSLELAGKQLCLVKLPLSGPDQSIAYVATVISDYSGVVWQVTIPRDLPSDSNSADLIREFHRFELQANDNDGLAFVLPVDPAGGSQTSSGFLDIFAKDVVISYSLSGRLDFWTARVDPTAAAVGWLSTSSVDTGITDAAIISGSTLKKAAMVDGSRSQLTIWDVGGARLEFSQLFAAGEKVQDLDWTSSPDSQSILAVGFQHRVILLSQMRYDYLNKGPAWASISGIDIQPLTPHPIGDSTWLSDGHLAIGAGNQLFVHDRHYMTSYPAVSSLRLKRTNAGAWDLFEAVQRLNGPLPVFHPQFLSQCILFGKHQLVHKIIINLQLALKFHVDGEVFEDYLGLDPSEFYSSSDKPTPKFNGTITQLQHDEEVVTEAVSTFVNDKLSTVKISQLSGQEQIQLADMVECVSMVEEQRRSLDENGARFVLYFRHVSLRRARAREMHLTWREINWALHSGSQDILTDVVSRQHQGNVLWENARDCGMFMWLTDNAALKKQFELVARHEYSRSDPKNPVNCSLFYLALRKKAVLQGLWRMASWNREQTATLRLLAHNFDDAKWRTAALKNAYALISKRRFEYAAAFFLLADHLQDAISVCLNQLDDLQLAVAVARAYEGDDGPILRRFLEDEVLPIAAREGNRWLASWAFWLLRRRDMSVRALIAPVYTLLETPCPPDMQSKSFLTDDPSLLILYSQLRDQTLQTLRGASKITSRVEWDFVLHNAKLYDRMGCDLLGLDLVRNWQFFQREAAAMPSVKAPLKFLRRRSSQVVADIALPELSLSLDPKRNGRDVGVPKFQEPEASSLLDQFGF